MLLALLLSLAAGSADGGGDAAPGERVIVVPLGPMNSPPVETPPIAPAVVVPDSGPATVAPSADAGALNGTTAPSPVAVERADAHDAGVTPTPVLRLAPPRDAGVLPLSPTLSPAGGEGDAGVVDAGVEPESMLSLRGAAEADLGLFPTGFPENGADLVTAIHPVIAFAVKDIFTLELGPTFRLRLIDTPALNRPSDAGQILRGADWDELSDFGQILQALRIGKPGGLLSIDVGPKRKKTLGLGHLLWRYSNQANPDWHPTGAELAVNAGPIHAELFASDLLGARLFAGEVAWDIAATFSQDPTVRDRYVLAFSVAHDAQLAGRPFRPDRSIGVFTPTPMTLIHLDASAVLVRTRELRWMVMAGTGTRASERSDLGFLVGTTLDAAVKEVGFSTRLELRKQAGGFRHGFFGPQYELQRFSDLGFRELSIGDALLPDSGSLFLELRAGIGTRLTFDVAAEYFFWNRIDVDGTLSLALLDDWLYLTARTTALGLLQQPRFHVGGGLRWRIFPSFYVLAESGTLFFPQADGTLIRGVQFSAGAGVDFER